MSLSWDWPQPRLGCFHPFITSPKQIAAHLLSKLGRWKHREGVHPVRGWGLQRPSTGPPRFPPPLTPTQGPRFCSYHAKLWPPARPAEAPGPWLLWGGDSLIQGFWEGRHWAPSCSLCRDQECWLDTFLCTPPAICLVSLFFLLLLLLGLIPFFPF